MSRLMPDLSTAEELSAFLTYGEGPAPRITGLGLMFSIASQMTRGSTCFGRQPISEPSRIYQRSTVHIQENIESIQCTQGFAADFWGLWNLSLGSLVIQFQFYRSSTSDCEIYVFQHLFLYLSYLSRQVALVYTSEICPKEKSFWVSVPWMFQYY